ncbi:hypothetical protein ACHAXR_006641 [Thalassiosira sp. AJA248-18]
MTEIYCTRVRSALQQFYKDNTHIGASHGLPHVIAVHDHAVKAIDSHNSEHSQGTKPETMKISDMMAMEIRVAAMLHDADDRKFFPIIQKEPSKNETPKFPNATKICQSAGIPSESISRILKMISWTGCSENGNSIPPEIEETHHYHLLIPRWSDRLEAVGRIGVIRCYQYNREIGAPLWKTDDLYDSPRPTSEEELWKLATPERFQEYLGGKNNAGGSSMISHYYDKLLHVARPPPEIVRNKYLEDMAAESSKVLVEVCLRFGETGMVDDEYILALGKNTSVTINK